MSDDASTVIDLTDLDAKEVAALILDDAEISPGQVFGWYDVAEPQERANFLQLLAEPVHRDFNRLKGSRRANEDVVLGMMTRETSNRQRIRDHVPLQLRLAINADLALGPGDEELSDDSLGMLIEARMTAILEEAFAADPALLVADLYLFRREEHGGSDVSEDSKWRHLKVRHAVGARMTGPAAETRARNEARLAFEAYSEDLDVYLRKYGTSINLEGHLDDKPNLYPEHPEGWLGIGTGGGTRRVFTNYYRKERILVAAAGEGKIGDYPAFLGDAVPSLVPIAGKRVQLQHFMEGIDVDFLTRSRQGTVAHLFLVREDDPAQALEAEHRRAVQRLLVRLCGFYSAATAVLESNRAKRQEWLVSRQAQDALRERNKLRAAAEVLGKISQELQQSISDISELIEVNFFIGRFNEWLKELGPLFDTDKPVDVPFTAGTKGHHTDWSVAQLAAAFWLFARPNPSGFRSDFRVSPDMAWRLLHAEARPSQINENEALMLIHRLNRRFDDFLKIDRQLVARCFSTFKSWYKGAEGRERREDEEARSQYRLSEILFLMGEGGFLNFIDKGEKGPEGAEREELFTFPNPVMLENLARLTHVIDSSIPNEDFVPGSGVTTVEVAIIKAADEVKWGARGSIGSVSFFANYKPNIMKTNWVADGVKTGHEGWLYLCIHQSDLAIAAASAKGDANRERNDDERRLSYGKLLETVTNKGAALSAERVELPGSERGTPQRRAGQETSTTLCKALGLLQPFAQIDPGAEHAIEVMRHAELVLVPLDPARDDSWPDGQPVVRIMGARRHGTPVALLSADLRTNCIEILIAPDTTGEE